MDYANSVEAKAARLLEDTGGGGPPVMLEPILEAYEFGYREADLNYTSGFLLVDPLLPLIVVNKRHPYERRRFTTAHELGHYFLEHPGRSFDEASPRKKTIERQADLFAANLLMPLPMIIEAEKAYRANPQHLVGNLAELFLVSRQAMKLRLKGLELMPRTVGDKRREYRK
jgi:Zn-dependent peptidase ImmA (M78 family)